MTTPDQDQAPADLGSLIDQMTSLATATDDAGAPVPIAAGTFAVYPMADGGLMFVTDCAEGLLAGTHRNRLPPAMIRAATALASGGGKLGALKALAGGGRRKVNDDR